MIEHKSISLADQVFEHLETDILSGKYQKGEILTESKLSLELGVSRTPIREALRRLEQEHLIEEAPKGVIVVGISDKDLADIFEIRAALEGKAAYLAAQNYTEEQMNVVREALEFQEFYLGKQDPDRIKSMDSRFHETIYKMSGSTIFYDVLMPLHKKILKYRKASVSDSSRAAASVAEHRAIYEALLARDAQLAERLISEHLDNAYKHICKKEN
ncbi:MAG: GntR family transcriptional regulator [Clostridia bacterium]|nr:GntR family transcriptional regulator [Clostridia bacterium]